MQTLRCPARCLNTPWRRDLWRARRARTWAHTLTAVPAMHRKMSTTLAPPQPTTTPSLTSHWHPRARYSSSSALEGFNQNPAFTVSLKLLRCRRSLFYRLQQWVILINRLICILLGCQSLLHSIHQAVFHGFMSVWNICQYLRWLICYLEWEWPSLQQFNSVAYIIVKHNI